MKFCNLCQNTSSSANATHRHITNDHFFALDWHPAARTAASSLTLPREANDIQKSFAFVRSAFYLMVNAHASKEYLRDLGSSDTSLPSLWPRPTVGHVHNAYASVTDVVLVHIAWLWSSGTSSAKSVELLDTVGRIASCETDHIGERGWC